MKYKANIVKACYVATGLPNPVFEYAFHDVRRWRIDIAWPDQKVGMEVQGGIWTRGKHGRGSGIMKDIEKHNEAVRCGWIIVYCVPRDVCMLDTVNLIKDVLALRSKKNES